jgi:hypothetical protein
MGKIMPIRPDADPDRPDPDRHGSGCRSDSGSGKMMPIRADPDPDPQHCETEAQTFRYRSLLSERKRNILIWSAYYRNKSKTL